MRPGEDISTMVVSIRPVSKYPGDPEPLIVTRIQSGMSWRLCLHDPHLCLPKILDNLDHIQLELDCFALFTVSSTPAIPSSANLIRFL